MSHILALWLMTAVAFMITAYLVPGFQIGGFIPALIAAAMMGLVNALIKPVLIFLTFPITIITLGLFLFVVNGLCIMLVSAITPGFRVKSFGWAMMGALVLSLVSWALHQLAVYI